MLAASQLAKTVLLKELQASSSLSGLSRGKYGALSVALLF